MPDGGGEPRQTRLVAFLDDASRLCCHGEFFHEETTTTLKAMLKAALYKRGVPQTLYVDNGSIYAGRDITLICGRLGILLCHTPVRDAAAKGKVERFFRTVREQFLSRVLDLTSLGSLNAAFVHWVEDEYNCRVHSTLGLKPVDRFALDLSRIRFLQTHEALGRSGGRPPLLHSRISTAVRRPSSGSFGFRGRIPFNARWISRLSRV